ncbi:hypothetical protein GCM10009682_15500 [Luedemannella flava]|uniref:Uncharacterized protein n=1 Tax=Luedemannella flava TaxID=349316 RepID=A0ABP4XXF1_9ACTN
MILLIAGVVAGPRLDVGGLTIFSGHLNLVHNRDFRGAIRATDRQPVAFFVPDSEPRTAAPAKTWLELGLRRVRTSTNPAVAIFGAYDERVDVAPDPRGGGHQWLQISMQVPVYAVEEMAINYRLTIQD